MEMSAEQETDLKLYPNRKHIFLSTGVLLFCSIVTLIADISLIIELMYSNPKSELIFPTITCFILTLVLVPACGILLRNVFRSAYWHTPTVTIDRQGMTCRYWFVGQRILVPWEEIAFLSSGVLGSTFSLKNPFLAVTLKDAERFAALYEIGQRRPLKRNPTTGAHFVVYQSWANMSIPAILQSIRERYSEELHEYGVRIL